MGFRQATDREQNNTGKLRSYTCRKCGEKFSRVLGEPLPKKERLCWNCRATSPNPEEVSVTGNFITVDAANDLASQLKGKSVTNRKGEVIGEIIEAGLSGDINQPVVLSVKIGPPRSTPSPPQEPGRTGGRKPDASTSI